MLLLRQSVSLVCWLSVLGWLVAQGAVLLSFGLCGALKKYLFIVLGFVGAFGVFLFLVRPVSSPCPVVASLSIPNGDLFAHLLSRILFSLLVSRFVCRPLVLRCLVLFVWWLFLVLG